MDEFTLTSLRVKIKTSSALVFDLVAKQYFEIMSQIKATDD